MKNFDHITYETFALEPQSFYAGRFAGGPGIIDYLENPKNFFNIEFGRARFLTKHVKGPRVLDLGCGSGPYAQTMRSHTDSRELIGLDLDSACVAIASKVYDCAAVFDLNEPLPFPDRYFDTVFSCDLFGHIEFRHKDQLLSEIARITQSNGRSIHIIESAPLDYSQMTTDPDDPIRIYVRSEGHVGIESAEALRDRWSRFFRVVDIENALLYPFSTLHGYLSDPATPGELKTDHQCI